jgi:hypothetical protein
MSRVNNAHAYIQESCAYVKSLIAYIPSKSTYKSTWNIKPHKHVRLLMHPREKEAQKHTWKVHIECKSGGIWYPLHFLWARQICQNHPTLIHLKCIHINRGNLNLQDRQIIQTYTCIYICIYIYIYVCVWVCEYVYINMYMCMCVCVHKDVLIHAGTRYTVTPRIYKKHIDTHNYRKDIHIHVRTHACMYVCTCEEKTIQKHNINTHKKTYTSFDTT